MPSEQLRRFAKALQGEIQRCQATEPLNPSKLREETLDTLLKERDRYKMLSGQEEKKLNDAKEVLAS